MTTDQRMAALRKADAVRIRGANVKRQLSTMPSRPEALALLADMLEQGFTALESVPVDKAISACRWCGETTVRKVLAEARVRPGRPRVGDLTGRERLELVQALRATS